MASSEAGMLVHGSIFKGVREAAFFFPNRMKYFFSSHICYIQASGDMAHLMRANRDLPPKFVDMLCFT